MQQDQEAQSFLQGVFQGLVLNLDDPSELLRLSRASGVQLAGQPNLERIASRAADSCTVEAGSDAATLLSALTSELPTDQQIALGVGLANSSTPSWRSEGRQSLWPSVHA